MLINSKFKLSGLHCSEIPVHETWELGCGHCSYVLKGTMDVFFLTFGGCGLEDDAGGCTEGERRDDAAYDDRTETDERAGHYEEVEHIAVI